MGMANRTARSYKEEVVHEPVVVEIAPDAKSVLYKNVGLFSDTFLQHHLPNGTTPFVLTNWETDDTPDFYKLYEWMLGTWDELKDILPTLNEAQLEEKWIRPILERLGWEYDVQATFKKYGKKQIPDYALFATKNDWKKARGAKTDDAYFQNTIAIADAKAMGIDLDGVAENNTNPGYQIIQYLTHTGKKWGILTNGLYWRIYSTRSKSRYQAYYEVNIEKFLAKGHPEPEKFKWFYNFFRKDAFTPSSASRQSFLDFVFDEGELYAQEVEVELKARAFELVEKICIGFAGGHKDLPTDELKKIYDHSLYFLFRLMFILNCEAKGLLHVSRQSDYFRYSLRSLCIRLKEEFEENTRWADSPMSYDYIINLFSLLAKGDANLGIHNFGNEVFASGERNFFKDNDIGDHVLNEVLVRLSCAYDKKKKTWQFIDYHRLSADHLGSLFEGLLEFHLVFDKKAKKLCLENSSGQRKLTGSYYTPDYIVDYIVQTTIGPILEKDTVKQVLERKFIDPAMGSGHFLLGVVRFVQDKILEKINAGDKSRIDIKPNALPWAILHSCVFGVDINPLAVELAKFSLWMYTATSGQELEPLRDQLLCTDTLKLKPSRGTVREFNNVAFDAAVGNPPYVRQESLRPIKAMLENKFTVFHNMSDLNVYFLEQGFSFLKDEGRLGMIVSNKWMRAEYGAPLREWLADKIERLIDFGDLPVFKGIAAYPCIVCLTKEPLPKVKISSLNELDPFQLEHQIVNNESDISRRSLTAHSWSFPSAATTNILAKIAESSSSFGSALENKVYRGVLTGLTEAFVIDSDLADQMIRAHQSSRDVLMPFVLGRDVGRYSKLSAKRYLIFMPKGWTKSRYPGVKDPWSKVKSDYPAIAAHLAKYNERGAKRSDKGDFWWELRACDYYDVFRKSKIVYLAFQVRPAFTIDTQGLVGNNAVWFIDSDDRFLLGYLNSKVCWYLISQTCTQIRGGYQLILKYLEKIQVPDRSKADKKTVAKIEKLVNKRIADGDISTENDIDNAFYDLFGFTSREIEAIESKWPKDSKRTKKKAA